MKKQLLTLILVLQCLAAISQVSTPTFKLRHTGFVGADSTKNFNILEFQGKKKNELYKSALVYLTSIYNSPGNVLSTVENESIVVNALTDAVRGDLTWYRYPMHYHIELQFKDGKMKIEPSITDLVEDTMSGLKRKNYLSSTDSPNKVEINCIWMADKKGGYFLFKKDLNTSIESWANSYTDSLVAGINKSDW
jgi:hypothetical protein